jgi:hypothetical protein
MIGVAIVASTFLSIGRFLLVLFPMYILLATMQSRLLERVYTVGSILLFALNITLFVNGYWAG